MNKSFILGKIAPEFIKNETLPELLIPTLKNIKPNLLLFLKTGLLLMKN
jgi:hypothetical protein